MVPLCGSHLAIMPGAALPRGYAMITAAGRYHLSGRG